MNVSLLVRRWIGWTLAAPFLASGAALVAVAGRLPALTLPVVGLQLSPMLPALVLGAVWLGIGCACVAAVYRVAGRGAPPRPGRAQPGTIPIQPARAKPRWAAM